MAQESDYASKRQRMILEQLQPNGVVDARVLGAIASIPRHRFVPESLRHEAYGDHPLPIGFEQTISQPVMVALMTQSLALEGHERVLEIGTGSGYQTAVLAQLAREVVSVERCAPLADSARALLVELGMGNISVHCGDGTLGWPSKAPYDAILVTAGGPQIPETLLAQLGPAGRLVCPVGDRDLQRLMRVLRTPDGLQRETGIKCVFVPLIGDEGWPDGKPS